MPTLSYLAYPAPGRAGELVARLRSLPGCSVTESDSELLVLVTETADQVAEKELATRLGEIDALACLALVFGHAGEGATEEVAS